MIPADFLFRKSAYCAANAYYFSISFLEGFFSPFSFGSLAFYFPSPFSLGPIADAIQLRL